MVIGILLALQINEWNQGRKDNLERIALTKSMISELAQDTVLLNSGIANYAQRLASNEELLEDLNGDDITFDSFKERALSRFNPSVIGRIENFNTVTFTVLQSTGQIDLFEDSLKTHIVSHYNSLST